MRRERVGSLLALAADDLAAAETLLQRHPRQAAFLIEQAAEKLLKAVLAAEGIAHRPSHQIGALAALLPVGHRWRADLAAFDEFSSYATATRYPTAGGGMPPAPDGAELREDLARVRALAGPLAAWCRQRVDGAGPDTGDPLSAGPSGR